MDKSQCSRRRFGPRSRTAVCHCWAVVAPFLSCEPREEETRDSVNELLRERPKADSTVKGGVYFPQHRGVYGQDSQQGHQSCLGSEGAAPPGRSAMEGVTGMWRLVGNPNTRAPMLTNIGCGYTSHPLRIIVAPLSYYSTNRSTIFIPFY